MGDPRPRRTDRRLALLVVATLWVGVGAACTEAPPGGSPDTGVVADVGADGGVDAEIDTGVMPTDAEVDAGIADAAEDGGAEVDGGPLDAGADAGTDGGLTCWSCHGANGNPAPPTDLQGRSDPALPTVGAHASHMAPRVFYRSGECADCHLVPAAVDDPGHVDPAPADLTWGPVPGAGGVAPSYVNGTCEVYCHGVSLNGGTNVNPSWTAAGQQTVVCGSCHGVPPPPPHPELQTLECGGCHPFSGLFPIDAARHVDGVLDVTLGCTACHGSGSDPAPPLDTQGRSATTFLTVGAHQAHLAPSPLSRDPVCSDCHLVPTAVGDPGHLGPAPAELEWGAVAQADNAVPSYDGTDGGCDVYCHGSTLSGGSNPRPIWNQVGAGQAACGACHGLPPPAPHPAVSGASCGPCHPFNGFIPDQPERHIDGILDVAVQCNTCHGSAANDAPPADTQGRTATTFRTVGAHQTHLSPGAHRTGRCADCHVVPTDVADPGHIDVAPAELTWGAVPQADGVNPAYAGNGTCTVYCHGASLSGGTNTTPTWNVVGAGEAACGACHGVPPPLPHPQVAASDCGPCHPFSGVTPDDPLRHVDGILDVAQGCTSCHGTGNDPAPPLDLSGGSATTSRGVGAHQSHLNAGPLADAVACAECHVVPLQVTSPGHLDGDGMAELNFGGLATHDGANASYNGATCTAYCHGATLAGGTNTQPTWTSVGTGEAACGACHGLPPPAPHPANPQCDTCHGAVVNAQLQIIDTSLHINGTVEALAQCGSCHGLPPATGAHLTHAGLAVAQYGALGTAADLTSPTGYAFGCGHCHPRDSSQHLNGGLAQVVLYDPSAPAGSLKALNPPTASYVPGPVTNTDAFGLSYTEGTCSDVYCHSRVDTTSSAPAVPGVDFPFTGYPIAYQPPPSVTRARGYTAVGWGQSLVCGDCHGFPARGAHPTVRDATGESHAFLRGDGQEVLHMFNHGFAPVPCRACHASTVEVSGAYTRTALGVTTVQAVPIGSFAAHVNGDVEVVFDGQNVIPYGPVSVSLAGAAWDPATRTCTNVGCHKLQTAVPFGNPYRTQVTPECNQCHRM